MPAPLRARFSTMLPLKSRAKGGAEIIHRLVHSAFQGSGRLSRLW
jgi:hypothetical protein